ncbi:hypothetical protein ABIE67_001757 [Streptomyces sp. V4I8]|uniref:hypothetical protein n=1 Tax=Streptomyces sp. V4I8 TaxID=3156469 RepID=UPI003514F930
MPESLLNSGRLPSSFRGHRAQRLNIPPRSSHSPARTSSGLGVSELNDPATQPAVILAHHSGDLAALSKVAPALFLRGFETIADWRPPQPPYASRQTPAGNHQRRTPREGRLHRTR